MELIDKAALVAEIEKRKKSNREICTAEGSGAYYEDGFIIDIINSLEVKEVDIENSMVCKVDWYDGFFLDYTQEQQDELLEKIGANVGDKIKVILIKK